MVRDVVWVAVRCCCQPTKVLGFLKMDSETIKLSSFRLPVRGVHIAQIREMGRNYYEGHNPTYAREAAIYSEDRPIEFWRRVKGFIEAGEPAIGDFGFDRLHAGFDPLDFPDGLRP